MQLEVSPRGGGFSPVEELAEQIEVARGRKPAELVLEHAHALNVFTGEVLPSSSVAIHHGRVVGIGDYAGEVTLDLEGMFLSPGLIDCHIHLESSLLTPREFVRAVLPLGTTAMVADPHEIANVAGIEGVSYLLEASRDLPFSLYFMAPCCVPASSLEAAGAGLGLRETRELLGRERVLGLGEVMDFPAVLDARRELLQRLVAARGRVIDGHAPGLSGKELDAYVAAGIGSDHECISTLEGREKLRAGMMLMIREGSIARDMDALLPLARGAANERCALVSDDLLPGDLLQRGHLTGLLSRAVSSGMDAVAALRLVTLNPARYFGLHDMGRIAPGAHADLVAFRDLTHFHVELVFQSGRLVARNGRLGIPVETAFPVPKAIAQSVHLPMLSEESFRIPAHPGRCRVIGLVPGQLLTEELWIDPPIQGGEVVAWPQRDLAKVAVIERHRASGRIGLGLVQGFGLLQGALASSVSHDAHNLVVIGTNERDMLLAAQEVERLQGGLVAISRGKTLGSVPLPIAGLVSPSPAGVVARQMAELEGKVRRLGTPPEHPFMALAFITLSVIPALKITAMGLVDSASQKLVPLFQP